jgi:hypothetical protein
VAPPSYRLDTLAVTLIARLEAVRRAHLTDAVAARAAIARGAGELLGDIAAECRETMGDEAQARRIEREGVETFLPRYTRIALAQNEEEAGAARGGTLGQLARRAAAVVSALLVAVILARLFPGPWDAAFYYLFPPVSFFFPELTGHLSRRRYEAELQALADDLGRLQEAEEQVAPAGVNPPLADPAQRPRRETQ